MNNKINKINFTANYIKPAIIKKNDGNGNFRPYKVSVAELDCKNRNDVRALKKTGQEWKEFSSEIYWDFIDNCKNNLNRHFYAITSQTDDYEHLRHDEIMGLAEFEEDKNVNTLVFLQVNPELNYTSAESEYKYIGTAMLDFLAATFPQKYIKVFPVPTAYEFYLKNDFTPIPGTDKRYLWNA